MENIAGWIAPIATTIAAFMTASNLGSRVTGWGFAVFTVGSIGWIALGLATHQSNLVWQNAILTGLNLFGIWRWLGRQAKLEDGAELAAEASRSAPGATLFPVSLLGRARVVGRNQRDLGSALDAMASCDEGRLTYLVVSSGGVGGLGESVRRLPWGQIRVDGDELRADIDQKQFEAIDSIRKDDWR